jgi:hypothetical protein
MSVTRHPRTDPYVRRYRIRLLPWMHGVKAHTRERMQDALGGNPMERYTAAQAYFLFLYNPIQLYAVNKAVEFVPYVSTLLNLDATSVTAQHWSVRQSAKRE